MVNSTIHTFTPSTNNASHFNSEICPLDVPFFPKTGMGDVGNILINPEVVKALEEQGEFNWNAEMQGWVSIYYFPLPEAGSRLAFEEYSIFLSFY